MRRTTALASQWKANAQNGETLSFDFCKGGYFSTKDEYGLKIIGRSEQTILTGKNKFDYDAFNNGDYWSYSNNKLTVTQSDYRSWAQLTFVSIPNGIYTMSWENACEVLIREGSAEEDVIYASSNTTSAIFTVTKGQIALKLATSGVTKPFNVGKVQIEEGSTATAFEPYCGGVPVTIQHCVKEGTKVKVLGKNLIGHDLKYWGFTGNINAGYTITSSDRIQTVVVPIIGSNLYTISGDFSKLNSNVVRVSVFEKYPILGETGFYNAVLQNGEVLDVPQNGKYAVLLFNTLSSLTDITSISNNTQLEIGNFATPFETYFEKEIVTPCNLYEGDVFYPTAGKVVRDDNSIEQYTPQPIYAQAGTVTVLQLPLDITATLSATMFKLKHTLVKEYVTLISDSSSITVILDSYKFTTKRKTVTTGRFSMGRFTAYYYEFDHGEDNGGLEQTYVIELYDGIVETPDSYDIVLWSTGSYEEFIQELSNWGLKTNELTEPGMISGEQHIEFDYQITKEYIGE